MSEVKKCCEAHTMKVLDELREKVQSRDDSHLLLKYLDRCIHRMSPEPKHCEMMFIALQQGIVSKTGEIGGVQLYSDRCGEIERCPYCKGNHDCLLSVNTKKMGEAIAERTNR